MHEQFWYLKSCSLFEHLAPEDVSRLESRARSRVFQRKQAVYLPSDLADSLLIVASGRVKLYHITPEGKETILAFIEPGEIFGELSVVDSAPRDEFAEAMTATRIILIAGDVVRDLMEQRPQLTLSVTKLIGLRRRSLERRMKALLFRSNRDRLVHILLDLAAQHGRKTARGVELGIKLSHQELAGLIGSTRETVTVLLGQLQLERLLMVERRMIILTALQELAASIDERTPELRAPAQAPSPVIR